MTSNPVYHFFHSPGNIGPFVLRFSLAGVFFYHGTQKAFGWFGGAGWQGTMASWTSASGMGLPAVLVTLVVAMELAVCASLFFGFLTRLAGLGVVAIMTGAMIALSANAHGFSDIELPAVLWSVGFAIAFLGGGALSVDRAISKNLLPIVG